MVRVTFEFFFFYLNCQSDILNFFYFTSIVQLGSVSCSIVGINWFQVNNNSGYPGYRQPERDMQWLSGLFW